jgi:hypothetical protein
VASRAAWPPLLPSRGSKPRCRHRRRATNSAGSSNAAAESKTNDDGADASLVGTSAGDMAAKAATDKLGGGKVVSVEKSDEGGPDVYEVKVDKAGTVTQVGDSYNVTATNADDDQHGSDQGDGDGESNDD